MQWMDASFAADSGMGMFQFDKNTCTTELRKIATGCKNGGWIQDTCAMYRLIVTALKDPSPKFVQLAISEMAGQFTCMNTDVSALGPKSPLAGTCTCWYSGMASVTDVFKKLVGGCSKVTGSDDPLTNN